jgi:hypothetical protein
MFCVVAPNSAYRIGHQAREGTRKESSLEDSGNKLPESKGSNKVRWEQNGINRQYMGELRLHYRGYKLLGGNKSEAKGVLKVMRKRVVCALGEGV